ncbi:MAG: GNAT family N-acetyltransferase [Anaerolineae bacterium]
MTPIPELDTERLRLRPFNRADAPRVQTLAGAAAIADTTLHIPHPYPDGLAAEWISRHPINFEEGLSLTLAIERRADHLLLGGISLGLHLENDSAEMGYWLGEPYWNHGYTTEAARALVRYGFEKLALHRIYAQHFARNPASGRVMEKAGMKYEGCLREHVKKGERYEDLVTYGILKSEFRSIIDT